MTERWIVATSMCWRPDPHWELAPGPVFEFMAGLAGDAKRPLLTFVTTAGPDSDSYTGRVHAAFTGSRFDVQVLRLMPMPNVPDLRAHLLASDLVWVGGGSVAGLLALWRLHGLDDAMREAWASGVVLGGVSAGSICWHLGGPTDSFGPTLQPITNGLGLLPYGNGVHYDGEGQRRPLLHQMVADQTVPLSYATDDGVGLVYRGTDLHEVISDRPGANAYKVELVAGSVVESVLEPRLLD
jgi:peptidase E